MSLVLGYHQFTHYLLTSCNILFVGVVWCSFGRSLLLICCWCWCCCWFRWMVLVSGGLHLQPLRAESCAQDSARLGLLPDSLAEWGAFILRATWRAFFWVKFAGKGKQQGRSYRNIRYDWLDGRSSGVFAQRHHLHTEGGFDFRSTFSCKLVDEPIQETYIIELQFFWWPSQPCTTRLARSSNI